MTLAIPDLMTPDATRLLELFGLRGNAAAEIVASRYHAARASFELFAGLDAPHLPSDSDDALQVRLARWHVSQFGAPRAEHLALGISEEAGEWWSSGNLAEEDDAVGDVMVFACQLATLHRLSFADCNLKLPLQRSHSTLVAPLGRGVAVGLISHVVLKSAHGIRGLADHELARVGVFLGISSLRWAFKFDHSSDCWRATAEKVMRRDWRADPVRGGES